MRSHYDGIYQFSRRVASSRKQTRTMKYLEFEPEEHPISAQLFGSDPKVMAEAARICEESGSILSTSTSAAR